MTLNSCEHNDKHNLKTDITSFNTDGSDAFSNYEVNIPNEIQLNKYQNSVRLLWYL